MSIAEPVVSRRIRLWGAAWIVAAVLAPGAAAAFDAPAVFNGRCSGCHSVGRGEVVGPDLAGVTTRHERAWLRAFIRSSQSVIRSGDRQAVALYARYRKTMPDHELGEAEIDALLDWIAGGGERDEERLRAASAATGAEAALGRDLFFGRRAFAAGGAACAHCHTAGAGEPPGGSLGGDLAGAWVAHGDWGLRCAIAAPRSPLMAEVYAGRPLAESEAFAVRAFLYRAARRPVQTASALPLVPPPMSLPLLGFAGSSALVLLFSRRPPGRPR
jgi:mono/diheme cytochrome c family protein